MKKSVLFFFIFHFSFLILNAQIINTIAGNGIAGYSGDGGFATNAEIWGPSGVFVDKAGNIYISDGLNNRIRKINTSGIITTIAGNGYNPGGYGGYSGDGGPATEAELYNPQSICIDALGNLYIADFENNRIRKVDTGDTITTIAGNGIGGFSGDGGPATACEFKETSSICFDTLGNLYIADPGNYRIRKINTSGIIATVAGGGITITVTDGVPATSVRLGSSYSIFVNDSGNIYISLTDEAQVYKVDALGNIYTVAGNGVIGFSGDGGPATAAEMYQVGIWVDDSNNFFIGDGANERVRAVNHSTGIITTIAGNGVGGYSGDGGPAADAEFSDPANIFVDTFTNLYISDYYNNSVREVTGGGILTGITSINNTKDITIFPNPASQRININFKGIKSGMTSLSIIDIAGREITNSQLSIINSQLSVDISSLSSGIYFASISVNGQKYTRKFIKI